MSIELSALITLGLVALAITCAMCLAWTAHLWIHKDDE